MLTITVSKVLHFIFECLETRDLSKNHFDLKYQSRLDFQ